MNVSGTEKERKTNGRSLIPGIASISSSKAIPRSSFSGLRFTTSLSDTQRPLLVLGQSLSVHRILVLYSSSSLRAHIRKVREACGCSGHSTRGQSGKPSYRPSWGAVDAMQNGTSHHLKSGRDPPSIHPQQHNRILKHSESIITAYQPSVASQPLLFMHHQSLVSQSHPASPHIVCCIGSRK